MSSIFSRKLFYLGHIAILLIEVKKLKKIECFSEKRFVVNEIKIFYSGGHGMLGVMFPPLKILLLLFICHICIIEIRMFGVFVIKEMATKTL